MTTLNGGLNPSVNQNPTHGAAPAWAEVIDHYLVAENANGRAKETQRMRREHLVYMGREIGCAPTELTADALVTWFGQQIAWKVETRRSYRGTIRSFVRWAYKAGLLAEPLDEALRRCARPRHHRGRHQTAHGR